MMLLFGLMLGMSAQAHPMASNLYGHRLELRLEPDRLGAVYVAEVPTPVVLRELRDRSGGDPDRDDTDRYVAELREELVGGLRLEVDGAPTAWTPTGEPAPAGEGDARFVSFGVSLQVALPSGARTLQIVNGNFPDEPSLYLTDLRVDPGVIIDDASLIQRGAQGEIRDRTGQWRAEEESRDLRLAFRARAAAWTGLLRAGVALSGQGEAGAWSGPVARLADAPWLGLEAPERVAFGVVAASGIAGLTLGRLLGGGGRGRITLLASAALIGAELAWVAALLVGQRAALCVTAGLAFGAAALSCGAWTAWRRAVPPLRTGFGLPVFALALALGAGAALFIWGSVQFGVDG